MPLTPHHAVHPWRLRISVILLGVVTATLCAVLWNHRVAADLVQQTVDEWIDNGATPPGVVERDGKQVVVGSDATDRAPAP